MNLYDNGICAAYSNAAGKKISCIKIRYQGGYNGKCDGCDGVLVKKAMEDNLFGRHKKHSQH